MIANKPFILSPYRVYVDGYGSEIYHAKSRSSALGKAYKSDAFSHIKFKDFLQMTECYKVMECTPTNYGRLVEVSGEICHYVSHNNQYMQIVRPFSDVIMTTHPLDVRSDWIGGYPLKLIESNINDVF
jgi:hypothetical protein